MNVKQRQTMWILHKSTQVKGKVTTYQKVEEQKKCMQPLLTTLDIVEYL